MAKTFFTLDSKCTLKKHAGRTWREIANIDPGYVSWAIKNVEWASFDPEVYQAVGEPTDGLPATPPPPKTTAETSKINMTVLNQMVEAMQAAMQCIIDHPTLGRILFIPLPQDTDPVIFERVYALLIEMQKTLASGSTYVAASLPVENIVPPVPFPKATPVQEIPSSVPGKFPPDEWDDPLKDDLPF